MFAKVQTIWVVGLGLALAVGGVVQAAPASAVVQASQCGQTITQDAQLTADLLNCPGDGLIIGADNVRLDLNGHTISGAPHGFIDCFSGGPSPGPCVGVYPNGHSGLTITNGTITNFDTGIGGVGARASSRDQITQLTMTANTNDDIDVGNDNIVAFNRVSSPVVVASRSEIAFNTATDRGSFIAFLGDHSRIERNVIHAATVSSPAIDLNAATNVYVANNWLIGGGLSVEARSDSDLVTSNVLVHSHLSVGGSTHVVVSKNIVLGTPPGLSLNAIRVGYDGLAGSDNVEVSGNVALGAVLDGIAVDYTGSANHTIVRNNFVAANGHDGIENHDQTATLAGNTAFRNVNLGIESTVGAVDGGGNHAAANGNPAQCTNITCR